MKYLLIGLLLLTGCAESKLWLTGYSESGVRARCEADRTNHRHQGHYDIHTKQIPYTDYSPERVQQNINQCVAQSRSNALLAGAPVIFTVPLIP